MFGMCLSLWTMEEGIRIFDLDHSRKLPLGSVGRVKGRDELKRRKVMGDAHTKGKVKYATATRWCPREILTQTIIFLGQGKARSLAGCSGITSRVGLFELVFSQSILIPGRSVSQLYGRHTGKRRVISSVKQAPLNV